MDEDFIDNNNDEASSYNKAIESSSEEEQDMEENSSEIEVIQTAISPAKSLEGLKDDNIEEVIPSVEDSYDRNSSLSIDEIALEYRVVQRIIQRNKEFLQEKALKRKATCNDSEKELASDFVVGKRACVTSSVDNKVNQRRSPRTNQTNEVSKGVIPQSLSPDSDDLHLPIKHSVDLRRSLRTNKKEELKRGRTKQVQTVISTTSNNLVNRKSTRCPASPIESRDRKGQKNRRQKPDNLEIVGTADRHAFCSNLISMLQMVQEMKLEGEIFTDVDKLMKSTPFGQLFQVFTEGNLEKKDIKKPDNGIERIMSCYDKKKNAFIFGGKEVAFKADDVALVFGLPMKGRDVKLHSGTSKAITTNTPFFKRNFKSNEPYVTKREVKIAMKLCVDRSDDHRVVDMCKLLIMYMFMTFLNAGTLQKFSMSALAHLDDLRTMGSIAWAKVIHKMLLKEVEKWVPGKPHALYTCPVLLLYFLLEHTNLASPRQRYNKNIPRAAKWSFSDLIIPMDLKKTKNIQVTAVVKSVDDRELGLLDEGETLIEEINTSETKEDQLRNALMDNEWLRKQNNLLEENSKKLQLEYNNISGELKNIIGLQDDDNNDDKGDEIAD